jgi:biopolymer transport protein ExbD
MKKRAAGKYMASINITSLIDLLFLLLIFFMVTSSLNIESSILVNLPEADRSTDSSAGKIVITITEDNQIFVNDRKTSADDLASAVRDKYSSKQPVVIRGDKRSSYQTIVEVMDRLNKAGMPHFVLSTVR